MNLFFYPDHSDILKTRILILSFKYFRVVRIEKHIRQFIFWEKLRLNNFVSRSTDLWFLICPNLKTTQPRSWYSSKKEYWHCSWTWETNFLLTKGTKGAELFSELGYCCLNSISPQKKLVVSFSLPATMRSSPFWSLIWITIPHSCFFKISLLIMIQSTIIF